MSSSQSSSSASRSAEGGRQRPSNPIWDNWPSISIMLPPQGVNNKQADQRCFTYCSQTVRGRAQQQEPWCRSICIRKVFRHEVRRAMNMHELQDAIRAYEREHSKLPEKIDASVPVKYKLPVEGQPRQSRNVGPSSLQEVSDVDADEDSPSPSRHGSTSSDNNDDGKVRYWEPGWYLWSTTSRWAAQEQMDVMSRDLKWQAEWQKYKDSVNEDYRRRQTKGEDEVDDDGKERVQGPRMRQSFPDLTENTWLVAVPPPHLILGNAIKNYMAPTRKLMALVQGTFDDGRQRELCTRMWEKAQTGEPWTVAQSAVRKVWKILSEGPPVDEGEERNKRGNSSS